MADTTTPFTPGNWKSQDSILEENYVELSSDGSSDWIARFPLTAQGRINGRFCSAAPDLYEALKACVEDLEMWLHESGAYQGPDGGIRYSKHQPCKGCSTCDALALAKAALSKATGEGKS